MTRVAQPANRVLLVSSAAGAYGADRATSMLARRLSQRGWTLTVMVPLQGPLVNELSAARIPVVIADPGVVRLLFRPLSWTRFLLFGLPASVVRVARLARGVDVVHVNTAVVVGAVLGGWLARRPVVLHVRESFQAHERVWRLYARIVRGMVTRVLAVSTEIAEECRRAGFRSVHLVHDGVEQMEVLTREERGDLPVVVSIGRLNAWKGHEVLVDAVGRLEHEGLAVRVEIAGDPFPGGEHFLSRLEAHISGQGLADRVQLLGFVSDVREILRHASVFVLASTRPEPFGLALVEAMAAGVPCIATAHGGPVDIIEHGRSGLLVPPGDATELADAIRSVVTDRALQSALASGGAAAAREFTADRVVDRVTDHYRAVLAGPASARQP